MNTRSIAAKSIIDIIDNKYSLLTLDNKLSKLEISTEDKSFAKLLCYEFFRNYYSLEQIIAEYTNSKTKKTVKLLLMLGLLQLLKINQPNYASINESVNACKDLNLTWAKKLINGVLRNILRNIDAIELKFNKYSKVDLPQWLIETIKQQCPKKLVEIAGNLNHQADMFIRLNQAKNFQEVINFLDDNKVIYSQTSLKNSLRLNSAIDVKHNELFNKGYFTVQDLSAQYAGVIINPQDEDIILDACAAPGGKTSHILELNPKAKITAIDIVDKRLELLKSNLNRVNADNTVRMLKHDLTKKLNGRFNKIILDAPCSAIGTLRRNPDIKVLRNSKDVKNIQEIQQNILQNLWDNNLTENGYLLYITCSILRQENQEQIQLFLDKNTNAEIIKIDILKEYETDYGYQILPKNDKGDGFYYCLIKKVF
ncbi:16S rRNA (cytosine(967)-C(5))-methyltransferase RsmB [Francisella sp. Scap27]|uniref:16S rRNA (cytosine(967)-C(5))-methyltransferase RsmB n=1 Tax=Francisella sp. Scap27 TaxID=2589986 RepID=UPI0015B7EF85|nr:16S rRNA (cytosine(967)-C(5))-methyltransferase RsmB [Francisella sp. Scap27]QLE79643.1 16S rRNA (cytosine(967)-C(5))-methyltransferase RsmB [Francisella sp. Scap27]